MTIPSRHTWQSPAFRAMSWIFPAHFLCLAVVQVSCFSFPFQEREVWDQEDHCEYWLYFWYHVHFTASMGDRAHFSSLCDSMPAMRLEDICSNATSAESLSTRQDADWKVVTVPVRHIKRDSTSCSCGGRDQRNSRISWVMLMLWLSRRIFRPLLPRLVLLFQEYYASQWLQDYFHKTHNHEIPQGCPGLKFESDGYFPITVCQTVQKLYEVGFNDYLTAFPRDKYTQE